MTVQLRDTQFGHLVRQVSRKRIFCYPDEIDLSLCKRFVDSGIERPQHDDVEAINGTNKIERETLHNSDEHNSDIEAVTTRKALEAGQDTFLVDWYDQEDPEACIVILMSSTSLICNTESSKLVTKVEASRRSSDLHSELRCVLCQFHLRTG